MHERSGGGWGALLLTLVVSAISGPQRQGQADVAHNDAEEEMECVRFTVRCEVECSGENRACACTTLSQGHERTVPSWRRGGGGPRAQQIARDDLSACKSRSPAICTVITQRKGDMRGKKEGELRGVRYTCCPSTEFGHLTAPFRDGVSNRTPCRH